MRATRAVRDKGLVPSICACAGPYLGGAGGATAPPDVFDLLQNSETNLQKYWAFKLALVVKSNIS